MSAGAGARRTQRVVSVQRAIAVMVALVVLPLALGALALLAGQWRSERAQADQELRRQAAGLVHAIDLYLGYGAAQLEAIAALPAMERADAALMYRYARDVVADRPGTIVSLIGPTGQLLFSTGISLDKTLPNLWTTETPNRTTQWEGQTLPVGARQITRDVFQTGERRWSGVFFGSITRQPSLAVAIPVKRDGVVLYALTLALPTAQLRSVIDGAGLSSNAVAMLLDASGAVLASNESRHFPAGLRAATPGAAGGGLYEPVAEWSRPDGTPMLAAHQAAGNGLSVLVAKSRSEALAMGEDVAKSWAALVFFTLVLSAFAAARLNRSLAAPLRRLAAQAQRGDLAQTPSSGIAEIDALKAALLHAADSEAQRRDEHTRRVAAEERQDVVRASERRMRRILDSLNVIVGVLDEQGLLLEANLTPIERAGLQRSDVIGRPFWDCFWWSHDPALQLQLRGWLEQALAGQVVRQDVLLRLEEGRLVAVDLQLIALGGDEGGARQVVASGVDIQARVDALSALQAGEAEARDAARRLDEQRWLLDAALEAMPAGIVVVDATGRLLRMNGSNLRLWGGAGLSCDDDAQPAWRGRWAHGHPSAGEAVQAHEWPMARALANARRETAVIEIEAFDTPCTRKTVLIS
ncbi:MAG TPA: PAS domain S-box protein, partial [Ramlibacter sp.]|nr:PAS domain S-box protein [Ramlibacter sp.]